MIVRIIRVTFLLMLIGPFAACTSVVGQEQPAADQAANVSQGEPALDYAGLVDNLRAAGATVEPAGEVSQSFFSVSGRLMTVNGEQVQVYEYANAAMAETEAAYIGSDGYHISLPGGSETIVEWAADPHFYRLERLIVLYAGDEAHVTGILEATLGPQFAGGPVRALHPIPATYNGIALPGGGGQRREGTAPPAWLIVGDEAIPAIIAAATEEGVIADPGNTVPDMSAIPLPANAQAVIVVGSDTIKSFQTSIRPWVEGNTPLFDPSDKKLAAESQPGQTMTAFTLAPIDDMNDLLLRFDISFPIPSGNGSASYIWRLSPGSATTAENAALITPIAPSVPAGGELSAQPFGASVTYTDYLSGLAFDIPAAWTVDGFQGTAVHLYAPDEVGSTGEAGFTLSLIGEGDLDFALNEVKRTLGAVLREVRPDHLGTFEALRLDLTPTGDWPAVIWLLATDSGHAVALMPKGDPTLIEPVLATLRAVPVRELKDLPPSVLPTLAAMQTIEIDSPIAGTEAGAAVPQPGWKTYTSLAFRMRLQYPPGWQPMPGYDQKYGDGDGFFQVSALSGHDLTKEEVCDLQARHHLQPYGSHPQIAWLQIQDQEACLILPSEDQSEDMQGRAALVVRYPQPVQIAGERYAYLILWADQTHIEKIAQALEFAGESRPEDSK